METKSEIISKICSVLASGKMNIESIKFSQLCYETDYERYVVENQRIVVNKYRGVIFWMSTTEMEIFSEKGKVIETIFVQLKGTNMLFKVTY